MPPLLEQPLLFVVSLVANILSAMAGGGAGLLQLPALIFLGLPLGVALGTHKIATVALGLGATVKHARAGNTELKFALIMLAAGMPGVVLGANIILSVAPEIAQRLLGALTISLGVYSYLKKSLGQHSLPLHRDRLGMFIGAAGLFLFGVLNGSLSSGSGLFVTVWLVAWFGFDFKQATAYTMILVGLFWNGSGAITLAMLAPIKWDWIPVLLLASLLGGYFGAHLAVKYTNPVIKRVFEVVTVIAGVALILKSL